MKGLAQPSPLKTEPGVLSCVPLLQNGNNIPIGVIQETNDFQTESNEEYQEYLTKTGASLLLYSLSFLADAEIAQKK